MKISIEVTNQCKILPLHSRRHYYHLAVQFGCSILILKMHKIQRLVDNENIAFFEFSFRCLFFVYSIEVNGLQSLFFSANRLRYIELTFPANMNIFFVELRTICEATDMKYLAATEVRTIRGCLMMERTCEG